MNKLILAGLVASASAFITLPAYAVTDNNAAVQEINMDSIINILSNVTESTSPEQLQTDLVEAINRICKEKKSIDLDDELMSDICGAQETQAMINAVVARFGADSPLVANFLAALSDSGIDSDTITLAAITAGVDATVASEATAAGPAPAGGDALPAIVSLPVPQGGGGTGGDDGISEVSN